MLGFLLSPDTLPSSMLQSTADVFRFINAGQLGRPRPASTRLFLNAGAQRGPWEEEDLGRGAVSQTHLEACFFLETSLGFPERGTCKDLENTYRLCLRHRRGCVAVS